jgi:hypothetical protein
MSILGTGITQTIIINNNFSGAYDDPDLTAENIKTSVVVGNITGTYDTEAENPISAGEVLADQVGFVNGAKVTGTMPNNAANDVEITTVAGTTIPAGYYNGSGTAVLSAAEAAKVIATNLKDGVTLLGVPGELTAGTDTSDATATTADIVSPATAYVNGEKIVGTLPARVWPEVDGAVYGNGEGAGYVLLTFDRLMGNPDGKHAEFSVEADSTPMTIIAVSFAENEFQYALTLSAEFSIAPPPTLVTVSYTKGTVLDSHGIPLQSFADVECPLFGN